MYSEDFHYEKTFNINYLSQLINLQKEQLKILIENTKYIKLIYDKINIKQFNTDEKLKKFSNEIELSLETDDLYGDPNDPNYVIPKKYNEKRKEEEL